MAAATVIGALVLGSGATAGAVAARFALAVIVWLLLRSWRAYRRHLDEPVPAPRRELEVVRTP